MSFMKWVAVLGVIGLVAGGAVLYGAFGAFLPWQEDAEAERLAIARKVGLSGHVYSTELSPEQRHATTERIAAAGLTNVTVLEGAPAATNLPDACCEVIVMRSVYHHLADPTAFAASIARALTPDGVVAIIDFEPGTLWFHGGTPDGSRRSGHGVARLDAIAELKAAGFTVREDFARWSGPLWLVIFERGR
jgi:SAM-dependent methyltransferase